MAYNVLVMGGGVTGMAVALELAAAGVGVYIAEKEDRIGGKAINYTCKATEHCQHCGACLAWQLKARVEEQPEIRVILNSEVSKITGEADNFEVDIRFHNVSTGKDVGAETTLDVNAVVMAVGFSVFDAAGLDELGYGLHKNVITTLDLESQLREEGSVDKAYGPGLKRIGFVHCVGSRDVRTGSGYCSRVCCKHSIKLAQLLRRELPDCLIDVFYLDVQTFGKTFADFWQGSRHQERLQFKRGLPAKVFRYPYDYLTVRYTNVDEAKVYEEHYDLLVLAPGMLPAADTVKLAAAHNVSLNGEGFLTETDQPGFFVAGACCGPKDIPQSIAHAQAVAGDVLYFLNGSR